MGVVDHIAEAKQLVEDELRFRIVDGDAAFALAVDRAGKRRVNHCVELVKLWQRPTTTGRQKYDRLMQLLRLVTPEKVGKYRNTETEAGLGLQAALDAELGDILRREP
jgi:hypothetical protein